MKKYIDLLVELIIEGTEFRCETNYFIRKKGAKNWKRLKPFENSKIDERR